ncbi:serine/threonine protein kinase [Ideonella sp. YS5]|uniref:serine/threonine protein kinase n=1 Tax=Ideonella sp. YS5 TaxID=3453714 RepID=UPI003EECBC0F
MLCPNCFEDKGDGVACAHCTFDESRSPPKRLCLPYHYALHDGRYEVGCILGKPGGFGVAYKAYDHKRPSVVVIKEFHGPENDEVTRLAGASRLRVASGFRDDFEALLEDFRKEVQLLGKLRHRNIVFVTDEFEQNGTHYYVMPYVEGGDLRARREANGGKLDQDVMLMVAHDLLDALDVVHKAGYVHCDIKPTNVLLTTQRPKAILIDFGAARRKRGDRPKSYSKRHAPPELFDEDTRYLTDATDIFLLCATLHHCLVGQAPPVSPDRVNADEDPYRPIASRVAGLHPSFAAFIDAGLSLDPSDRPGSVAEARRMIPPRVQAPPPPPPLPAPPPPASSPPAQPAPLTPQSATRKRSPHPAALLPAALALVFMITPQGSELVGPLLTLVVLNVGGFLLWKQHVNVNRPPPGRQGIRLTLYLAGETPRTLTLGPMQSVVIGRRSPPSTLAIASRTLSSQHVSVTIEEDGSFTLRDLGSTNHTFARQPGDDDDPEGWAQVSLVTKREGEFMLGAHYDGGVRLDIQPEWITP